MVPESKVQEVLAAQFGHCLSGHVIQVSGTFVIHCDGKDLAIGHRVQILSQTLAFLLGCVGVKPRKDTKRGNSQNRGVRAHVGVVTCQHASMPAQAPSRAGAGKQSRLYCKEQVTWLVLYTRFTIPKKKGLDQGGQNARELKRGGGFRGLLFHVPLSSGDSRSDPPRKNV